MALSKREGIGEQRTWRELAFPAVAIPPARLQCWCRVSPVSEPPEGRNEVRRPEEGQESHDNLQVALDSVYRQGSFCHQEECVAKVSAECSGKRGAS